MVAAAILFQDKSWYLLIKICCYLQDMLFLQFSCNSAFRGNDLFGSSRIIHIVNNVCAVSHILHQSKSWYLRDTSAIKCFILGSVRTSVLYLGPCEQVFHNWVRANKCFIIGSVQTSVSYLGPCEQVFHAWVRAINCFILGLCMAPITLKPFSLSYPSSPHWSDPGRWWKGKSRQVQTPKLNLKKLLLACRKLQQFFVSWKKGVNENVWIKC